MDHAEARELLDLAAVERNGLDRLIAGDTPSAIALAGHLAGCSECTEEFGRLRRGSAILRDVIATQPSPELRARTLEFVAAVGRPRGTAAVPRGSRATDGEPPASVRRARRVARGPAGWLAAIAAAAVISAGVTGYAVTSIRDQSGRQASQALAGLAEVAQWTARLETLPDVRRVVLTAQSSGGGQPQVGALMFSPHTQWLVVVADGLPEPPAGREYRCWVEIGGTRQRLGGMEISGDVAYWAGAAPTLADVPSGSLFGVSLADAANPAGATQTVLSGTLQAT
jgi:hypothetical protein